MALDTDVEKLFETHTVDEVKQQLNKIRNNIEKKKEDLRVMVGERYRDLIEAADTIQQMELSSAGVCEEVATVQKLCSSLQHRGLIGFKTAPHHSMKSNGAMSDSDTSVAAQVKVVVLASSRIWSLLERTELLAATQLFLLTQHTHTALMLSQVDVSRQYPVLARQWASVCQLPGTITRLCHHTITSTGLHRHPQHMQRVCQAVVSLLLLQSDSLSSALQKVLKLLEDSLLQSLVCYTPQQTARPLVTAFAEQMADALTLLHAVFAADPSNLHGSSVVEQRLQQVVAPAAEAADNSALPVTLLGETEAFLTLLPPAVRTYRPRVGEAGDGGCRLAAGELAAAAASWLAGLVDAARQHLTCILGYCPSLHSLRGVRDSVWSALDQRDQQHWQTVTAALGLGSWCPWQGLVRSCLQQHAQALVGQQLRGAVQRALQDVTALAEQVLNNDRVCYEEGAGAVQFVWCESHSDLPEKVGWLSAAQRSLHQAGGLAYKSHGYTARTQAICGAFNCQLAALRQDLDHLRSTGSEERLGASKDYEALLLLLQEQAGEAFKSLVGDIERLAAMAAFEEADSTALDTAAPDDLWASGWEGQDSAAWLPSEDRSLLRPRQALLVSLARLCRALANTCPNMTLCALATALVSPDTVRRVSLGLAVEGGGGEWVSVQGALEAATTSLLQAFLSSLTQQLVEQLHHHLLQPLQTDPVMAMLTVMAVVDSVEVCEEGGEEGQRLVSKLAVPAQPSPGLCWALHHLCRALNTATLHSLDRSWLARVPGHVCRSVVEAYSSVVACAVAASNQQLALHLIFDLKFVAATMLPTDPTEKDTAAEMARLQQQLEGCVDPFDLSVFQSHLSARVRAAANRCQVVLGAVYVRDRQHPVSSLPSPSTALLPLVPVVDIPRFSNVPLPKVSSAAPPGSVAALVGGVGLGGLHTAPPSSTPQAHQDKEKSVSGHQLTATSPLAAVTSSLTPGSRSATSIFSAMSSSWFGGTTSK